MVIDRITDKLTINWISLKFNFSSSFLLEYVQKI